MSCLEDIVDRIDYQHDHTLQQWNAFRPVFQDLVEKATAVQNLNEIRRILNERIDEFLRILKDQRLSFTNEALKLIEIASDPDIDLARDLDRKAAQYHDLESELAKLRMRFEALEVVNRALLEDKARLERDLTKGKARSLRKVVEPETVIELKQDLERERKLRRAAERKVTEYERILENDKCAFAKMVDAYPPSQSVARSR